MCVSYPTVCYSLLLWPVGEGGEGPDCHPHHWHLQPPDCQGVQVSTTSPRVKDQIATHIIDIFNPQTVKRVQVRTSPRVKDQIATHIIDIFYPQTVREFRLGPLLGWRTRLPPSSSTSSTHRLSKSSYRMTSRDVDPHLFFASPDPADLKIRVRTSLTKFL